MNNTNTNTVILFGASVGGQRAIEHYRTLGCNIVAIADNDQSKHGLQLMDVPIINPTQISQYPDCRIVICSMYFQQVRRQLVNDFAIDSKRITVASATVLKGLKPLERGQRYELSRYLMLTLTAAFRKAEIPYYIDHGTLLGLIREGDLLPWDNDVDIAIDAEFAGQAFQLIKDTLSSTSNGHQWQVMHQSGQFDTQEGSLQGWRIIKVTDAQLEASSEHLVDFIIKHKVQDTRYWLVGATTLQAPDKLTSARTELEYQGQLLSVPAETETYLELLYGDWATPKQEWSHASYTNICNE